MFKFIKNRKVKKFTVVTLIALIVFAIGIINIPINTQASTTTPKSSSVTKTTNTVKVSGNLKVHYIDVGQADSILIEQNKHFMLIDAGNNADGNLVVNYLKQQKVSKLDYVIGTHPHEDHIGGLDVVIKSFSIGKVFMPKKTSTTATYRDVITTIKSKKLNITLPTPNTTYSLGQAKWTILAPAKNKDYEDVNNYSIVCKLKFGNNTFLFDGDAEAISEMEMVKAKYDLKADVLKVGHHGSSSSTCANFLNAVNPKYAIISVGKDNSYNHPQKSTMDRLKAKNIKVYRTDECGTIVATSDGNKITFDKKQGSYNYRDSQTNNNSNNTKNSTTKTPIKPTPQPSQNQSQTVYITKSGNKYHTSGCSSLSKSKIPISLKDAKAKRYTPCSKCNPPK